MVSAINRTIKFSSFDKIHLDKVIDLLTDINTIMLEDATDGDDYRSCRQIEMMDINTGEIVAIRSEIEDIAMALSNLYTYMAEHVNVEAHVECKDVGEYPSNNDWGTFDF